MRYVAISCKKCASQYAITVASETGQIQSFPRRFFDPRRPKQKPTTEEMEEWLMQYDPVTPDDPKRVLSHKYEVRLLAPMLPPFALILRFIHTHRWPKRGAS